MNRTLLTLAMVAVSMAAYAQAKINFNNDTLHLVYFSTDTSRLVSGDAALAGIGLSSATVLAQGGTIEADLWAGSSSDALSLYKTTTFSAVPGKWQPTYTLLSNPDLPGHTLAYFQVVVHDSRITGADVPTLEASALMSYDQYYGWTPVFTAVPSPSAYVNLYATASPTSSTWPIGTQDLPAYGNGAEGSIELVANLGGPNMIPEPTTMALAGLGLAGLLMFRRRPFFNR